MTSRSAIAFRVTALRLAAGLLAAVWLAAVAAAPTWAAGAEERRAIIRQIEAGIAAGRERKPDEAVRLLTEALAAAERDFPKDDALIASATGNLGIMHLRRRDHAAAIPLLARHLAIKDRTVASNDPSLVVALGHYAEALEAAGRHAEAEPFFARVLDIRRAEVPQDELRLADAYRDYADSIRRQQRPAQTLAPYAAAAALYRRVPNPTPAVRRALAISLSNLGNIHFSAARHDLAWTHYEEALGLFTALGKPDRDWSNTAVSGAMVLRALSRHAESEALMRRAIEWRRTALKPDDPAIASAHYELGVLYVAMKRWSEAEEQFRIGLGVIEKGRNPAQTIRANHLGQIALALRNQGKIAEALEVYGEVMRLRLTLFDREDPLLQSTVRIYADLLRRSGNAKMADAFLKELAHGKAAADADMAPDALDLAVLDRLLSGHHRDATTLADAAVASAEAAGDDVRLARVLGIRSQLRILLEQYDLGRADAARFAALVEAMPAAAPSLKAEAALRGAMVRVFSGQSDPETLARLDDAERLIADAGPDAARLQLRIAAVRVDAYLALGRVAEAAEAARRLPAVAEGFDPLDPDRIGSVIAAARALQAAGDPQPGKGLADLLELVRKPDGRRVVFAPVILQFIAGLDVMQGRTALREAMLREALSLASLLLPANHGLSAGILADLGDIMLMQGRLAEGEALSRRALGIYQAKPGTEPASIVPAALRLASTLNFAGRPAEALPLARMAADMVRGQPTATAMLPNALSTLALIQSALGRSEPARQAVEEAQAAIAGLPAGHPMRVAVATIAGRVAHEAGRYPEAVKGYERAVAELDAREAGRSDRQIWMAHHGLALARMLAGDATGARAAIRDAATALGRVLAVDAGELGDGSAGEQRSARATFELQATLAVPDGLPQPASAEAYAAVQWAVSTAAARALAQVGARFGAGTGDLAALVRKRQDLIETWKAKDRALLGTVGRAEAEQIALSRKLRDEIAALRRSIQEIDGQLAVEYPNFADLTHPRPLPLEETQALIRPDEALIQFVVTPVETIVVAVTREGSTAYRAPLAAADLTAAVARLRRTLDPSGTTRAAESAFGEDVATGLPSFDRGTAHQLWTRLIGPALPTIAGKRHLLVVPDGALTSLPLGVLVTEPPAGDDADPAALRATAWAIRRYALTTLPSISSLKALRVVTRRAEASEPLRGFGAPKLIGAAGATRSAGALFRGRLADPEAVRGLAPLPGTEAELRGLAAALRAPPDAVTLGEAATETAVKRAKLGSARIVVFATHGLVTGELRGLTEPALVFTPPDTATEEDDGLLTASEAARLDLSADWVVLSACNTAAGDGTPGAEGLSGLARAFLFAGARAILVSHWPVRDDAAKLLTTETFAALAADPALDRAEALRRASERLLDTDADPTLAHPSAWAPFVVVGEGGAG